MATPPLPDFPCVRASLSGTCGDSTTWGVRHFFKYSGSAPSGANCVTLATDIATQWATDLSPQYHGNWILTAVDVLDIATDSGYSGLVDVSHAGTRSGTPLTSNDCMNVEFGISRRYRGGKPRVYLPPGVAGDLATDTNWTTTFADATASAFSTYAAAIEALTIGSMGTLTHVNLSYYKGYNTNSPPWRGPGFKYPPKYRDTALSDPITGYFGKVEVGSQRRRRTATTP